MKLTNEDKMAMRLVDDLDKMSLDLDKVGRVLAHISTNLTLNRLEVIIESAQEEKGELYVRYNRDTIR